MKLKQIIIKSYQVHKEINKEAKLLLQIKLKKVQLLQIDLKVINNKETRHLYMMIYICQIRNPMIRMNKLQNINKK